MGRHEPGGGLLAIHSVCVAAEQRRRGVASRLLRAYQGYVAATTPGLREVRAAGGRAAAMRGRLLPAAHRGAAGPRAQARLICKEPLVPLYAGAGFQLVGPSDVVHGRDPWFEMRWAPEEEGSEGEEGGGGGDAAAAAAAADGAADGQQQHGSSG